jgi:hypothetical protein
MEMDLEVEMELIYEWEVDDDFLSGLDELENEWFSAAA